MFSFFLCKVKFLSQALFSHNCGIFLPFFWEITGRIKFDSLFDWEEMESLHKKTRKIQTDLKYLLNILVT